MRAIERYGNMKFHNNNITEKIKQCCYALLLIIVGLLIEKYAEFNTAFLELLFFSILLTLLIMFLLNNKKTNEGGSIAIDIIDSNKKLENYVDENDIKLGRDINKFDPYIGYWNDVNKWIYPKLEKETNKIRKKINNKNLRILDIGTGNGFVVSQICKSGDEIWLLDSDEKRLKKAKNFIETQHTNDKISIETILERYENYQNVDKFDIIICSHVIQHISTELVSTFYDSFYNMINPDGNLFLLFPISTSKYDEFAVDGVEFDKIRIEKDIFNKCKRNNSLDYLSNLFAKVMNFPIQNMKLEKYNDFCKEYKGSKNNSMVYEIIEYDDCAVGYRRNYNKGLNCAISNEYDKDSLKTLLENRFDKNFEMQEIVTSEFALLKSKDNQFDYLMMKKNNQTIFLKTLFVIEKHREIKALFDVREKPELHRIIVDLLSSIGFSSKFTKLIKINGSNKFEVLAKKSKKDQPVKLIIYETKGFYSFVLSKNNAEFTSETDFNSILLSLDVNCIDFDKKVKLENLYIDTESDDGYIIEENGKAIYYLLVDRDWLRIYGLEMYKQSLKKIKELIIDAVSKDFNINMDDLNTDDFAYENVDGNTKFLTINYENSSKKEGCKKIIIPRYKILSTGGGFLVYRNAGLDMITENTFDNLCKEGMNEFKVLPSRKFDIIRFKRELKQCDLHIKKIFYYHYQTQKKLLVDFIKPRDKFFNIFPFKYSRYIRKKYQCYDCFCVIKRK